MNINAIKLSLLTYFQNLGLYDYLAFGWLLLTFLILIFLATLVAKKSSALSLLIIIVALLLLSIAPFVIYHQLNTTLRNTKTEITLLKKLNFSSSVILEATISNQSHNDFHLCVLHASLFKTYENVSGIKSYLYQLKSLANQSIVIKEFIPKEGTLEYQMVFDDFEYGGDINATFKARCY